jgi:hypothetical protein
MRDANGPEEPLGHPHFPEGVPRPPLGPGRQCTRRLDETQEKNMKYIEGALKPTSACIPHLEASH